MNRKFIVGLILLLSNFQIYAQSHSVATVKGRLKSSATGIAANEVQVSIPYLKLLTVSNEAGEFSFTHIPYGVQRLIIGGVNTVSDTISISVDKPMVDIGWITVTENDAATQNQSLQIPTIAMEENDGGDEESGVAPMVSSLLTASRDPFLNTASFVFGTYRFQTRGYDRNQQQVFINGAPMNDIETGDAYWSQWGGLNDVFRGRSNTYGLQPSEYGYGGINGLSAFDATAANQRKQTRVSYALTNRQYRNRLMVTHNSGLNKKGWAYSLSFSKRWAKEGYVPGTFYDGYSYFAAISKRFNNKHDLNLTIFGAPTKRGKSAPSYREANEVLGTNFYNANWGYQNGEKRNAKIGDIHQPVILLNYEYNPSESLKWNTSLGYQFGKNKNSTLDWYNAADPRPDYYKYLPSSYFANTEDYASLTDAQKTQIIDGFKANSQINWDALYHANQLSNGRSVYVIGNDVDAIKKWMFNTSLQKVVNSHINVQTGISFIQQNTNSYREMLDLLGGSYFMNVNSFTERNFGGAAVRSLNDMNNPNTLVKEGDKYYYNYNVNFLKAWWWGQGVFTYNKVDFFLAANYGINAFQREGLYRNGLFENDSYGKGKKQNFSIYGFKGGLTYKLNGRHYLFVNAAIAADAPTVDNTYFSSRIRNTTIDNPTVQKTTTIEAGYLLRAPKTNIRLVGYATDRKDAVDIQRFFYQGTGSSNSMVAYVLQNVNTRYTGLEMAVEYKFNTMLSATAVAAIGQAFYTNNPNVTIHQENAIDSPVIKETAYLNNMYLGVGPQSAYSLGVNYRSKKYWYVNVNFNYLSRNYVDPAAPRRTTQAVEGIAQGSDAWHAILDQEELQQVFTIDLFGGKSFLLSKKMKFLPRNTYLYLNVGINNLLDNKNIPTGGFENPRFDYTGFDASKYASKYFYGFGRNYFINLSLKF